MTSTVPSGADGAAGSAAPAVPVWDVWVRLFHWSLALAIGFQLLSGLTGFAFFEWHGTVGEIVLALMVFRLLWGLVGSRNARLSDLVSGPAAVLRHFRQLLRRDVPPERGHNAAGGWAVVAMLVIVGVQAGTGLYIADEDELLEGPRYADVSGDTSDFLWRVHTINANLLEAIVILHISMIALYRFWARRDLVVPMITGRSRTIPASGKDERPTVSGKLWKGALCALGAALMVAWIAR